MNTQEAPVRITDFAFNKGPLHIDGELKGSKLLICDKEYDAWFYDSYIFDAISIASKWQADQVTYERICHLRTWIRENIQHVHDLPYKRIRSMQSAKKFITRLIDREYGDMPEWKERKAEAIRRNNEIFK